MKRRARKPGAAKPGGAVGRSATELRVRKRADEAVWEFVHPRCALDRADDLEEVQKMIVADEIDIAIDELRWLLGGCSDFIDAHKLLGELALAENDIPLARGHFGYAFQIGSRALKAAGNPAPLPYRLPANTAFHEAGKGLAFCLKELGKQSMCADVVQLLLRCDPSDPLAVSTFLTLTPLTGKPPAAHPGDSGPS